MLFSIEKETGNRPVIEIVGFLSSLYYARGAAIKEFRKNFLMAASLFIPNMNFL